MNDTKSINQPLQGNGKKKTGIAATAGAAAAGLGGAAAAYAATRGEEAAADTWDETPEPVVEAAEPSQPQSQPQQPAATTSATSQPQSSSEDGIEVVGDNEIVVVDETAGESIVVDENEIHVDENEIHVDENEIHVDENEIHVDENEIHVDDPTIYEPVNPDEIAEAIISEEMIDPNDIDMADVVTFDEIGTVYNVNGEAATVASFHDNNGNQLTMIDIDGDGVFDLLGDTDGNLIVDETGALVAINTGVTVSDAELDIHDDDTYLAADDNNLDEFGADSLAQDMLG